MFIVGTLRAFGAMLQAHLHGFATLAAITLALFVVICAIECAYGTSPKRYLSKEFFHDVGYLLYYRSGAHHVLITAAALQLMGSYLGFLNLGLVSHWPIVLRYFAYWIVYDFMAYWVHRWKHTWHFLWAFHAVHHSQERLTFATIDRGHPFEQLFASVLGFLPAMVLGAPGTAWLPLELVRRFLEAIQHSAIPWDLGPFYWILVSPRFHAFHHSVDPAHHDRNFGTNFSVWDFIFGTAVAREANAPVAYGVPGIEMRTLGQQLIVPFQMALSRGGSEVGVKTPLSAEPPSHSDDVALAKAAGQAQ